MPLSQTLIRYRLGRLANLLLDVDHGISAKAEEALYDLVEAVDEEMLHQIKIRIRATDGRFYYKEKEN